MADVESLNFARGKRTVLPLVELETVDLGDLTIGRATVQPGWRWSTHMQPTAGGDLCQARHVGMIVAGQMAIRTKDGRSFVLGKDDVYHIPPGHDGWVVGDEPVVTLEWSGVRPWTGLTLTPGTRVLRTLLFTDLVDSTRVLESVGDRAWRDLLSSHLEAAREAINVAGGAEIATTGDGMLATFEGPIQAILSAQRIIRGAEELGLKLRAGVHIGEVELVGKDVRGSAVHQAARIMSQAGGGEVYVSEITKTLAGSSGLAFQDRGLHELKGFSEPVALYSLSV